jgi:HK97 family phage portal protein
MLNIKFYKMDIFGIKALKEQNRSLVNSIKALQKFNNATIVSDIRTMIFPNWQSVKEIDAYIIFDDVYSIVSRLATSSAAVKIEAYNETSGEDLPATDPAVKYLKSLTMEQKEQLYTWLLLCGEVFIYKDALRLGPNKRLLKTNFLHPSFMTVIQETNFPYTITGYRYQDTQATFTLMPEEIIYIKYFNPTTRLDERHRGMSPIKALAQRLTRLQANMSASVSQMQNGGVPSIVYDKTPGLDSARQGGGSSINEEVSVLGQRKDSFSRFLRNSDNKGAPYFAAGEMGVLPLGLSLVELDALMQADVDFDKICNAFSISSVLFNNKKASTESNVKEMRKDMYTNAILPNVKRVCDALTVGTRDIFGDNKCFKPDFSDIPELQEDMKQKADGWAALPAIVINEMRVSMGQDESTDPLADKLLIKTGYQLSEDLNMDIEPIEDTANDYGGPNKNNS